MSAASATTKYIRTSAQKAGLVLDQIRGRDVAQALATLRFSRKLIARDIEKLLRSAVANAQQTPGFGGDVDRLFVKACFANQGPSDEADSPGPDGPRVPRGEAHGAHHGRGGGASGEGERGGCRARARRTGKAATPPAAAKE